MYKEKRSLAWFDSNLHINFLVFFSLSNLHLPLNLFRPLLFSFFPFFIPSPLSFSVCRCLCLSVCLLVCLSDCLSLCLSVCLFLCLYLSVCLSICLSVCLSLSPSISLYMYKQTNVRFFNTTESVRVLTNLSRKYLIHSLVVKNISYLHSGYRGTLEDIYLGRLHRWSS